MSPKISGALVAAFLLAGSIWSYPANALTFHWSIAGGNIGGFITGLEDTPGLQPADNVTVTVTTPEVGGLGDYVPTATFNRFIVFNGAITFALFESFLGDYHLLLGLDPSVPVNNGLLQNLVTGEGLATEIVFEATPLPAALTLFAGGLGVIGLLGRRRKQTSRAAVAA
jgi:hypothetical protein